MTISPDSVNEKEPHRLTNADKILLQPLYKLLYEKLPDYRMTRFNPKTGKHEHTKRLNISHLSHDIQLSRNAMYRWFSRREEVANKISKKNAQALVDISKGKLTYKDLFPFIF